MELSKTDLLGMVMPNSLIVGIITSAPLVVGRVLDIFHRSEGFSGILSSLEISAMAFTSILLSAFLLKINVRKTVIIGGVIFCISNLLAWWAAGTGILKYYLIMRVGSGIGGGVIVGAVVAIAAGVVNPVMVFAFITFFEHLGSMVVMSLITVLADKFGPTASFGGIAGLAFLILPFMVLFFPQYNRPIKAAQKQIKFPFTGNILLLLASTALFSAGINIVLPYFELIGRAIHIPLLQVNGILVSGQVLSLMMALLAGYVGHRVSKTKQSIVLAALSMAFPLITVYARSFESYAAGGIMAPAIIAYFWPFFASLLAFFDRTGRLNAAGTGITITSIAIGPFIGGTILETTQSYLAVGWVSFLFFCAFLIAITIPSISADRELLFKKLQVEKA